MDEKIKHKIELGLRKMLPHASGDSVHQIFEVMLDFELSSEPALKALLADRCTVKEIYTALVFCRNIMMLELTSLDNLRMRKLLVHHDNMVFFLMKDLEDKREREWRVMQVKILHMGHEHAISKASNEWMQEQEIVLYNYYKEMPVVAKAKLLHVGEHSFTIKRDRDLAAVLSASKDGDTTLTRLPKSDLCMLLTVDEVTNATVHLRYGGFLPVGKESRRNVRVQCEKPIEIKLRDSGFQQWTAQLQDYSESGLGLVFAKESGIEAGVSLVFGMIFNGRKVMGKATVAWMSHEAERDRVGLSLEYEASNQRVLECAVSARKKTIVDELQRMGIPRGLQFTS